MQINETKGELLYSQRQTLLQNDQFCIRETIKASWSVGVIHLDQLWFSCMCWSPDVLGAEAQLGLGRTHLTVRAPRRLHLPKDPAIHTETPFTPF